VRSRLKGGSQVDRSQPNWGKRKINQTRGGSSSQSKWKALPIFKYTVTRWRGRPGSEELGERVAGGRGPTGTNARKPTDWGEGYCCQDPSRGDWGGTFQGKKRKKYQHKRRGRREILLLRQKQPIKTRHDQRPKRLSTQKPRWKIN